MIRKFNYTHREKIKRKDTLIAIDCSSSAPEIKVNLRIENYRDRLPVHGVVYVEAYHRAKYERFPFGTVGQLKTPDDLFLKSFACADVDNVRFRVKVVDETEKHGRIIAMADKIGAVSDEMLQASRISLLEVDTANLDQRVWELNLESDMPCLILNSKLSDPHGLLKNNEIFFSAIYPEIVRQVLTEVLSEESEQYAYDDECDDWQYYWLCFGKKLTAQKWPPNTKQDKCKQWIENVVNSFCRTNRVLQRLETAGGEVS